MVVAVAGGTGSSSTWNCRVALMEEGFSLGSYGNGSAVAYFLREVWGCRLNCMRP